VEEVEVGQPERHRHQQPEHGGDDHAGANPGASRPEADGDQGLADGDDHDQPVTFDEVRWLHPPAARPTDERSEEADGERGQPEHRPEPAVDEPRGDDERGAGECRGSDPQDRRQQVSVAPVLRARTA
jgi:hypothetical protein